MPRLLGVNYELASKILAGVLLAIFVLVIVGMLIVAIDNHKQHDANSKLENR